MDVIELLKDYVEVNEGKMSQLFFCKKHNVAFREFTKISYLLGANIDAENERPKERYKDYERLWEIADQDKCDGDCDSNPPYKTCPECTAGCAINQCGEIRDDALRGIEQALKGEVK